MVRIVALGLIIAGVAPTALAKSSTINIRSESSVVYSELNSKLNCQQLESLSCKKKQEAESIDVNGDLWLRSLTQSILPDSPFIACNDRYPGREKQLWKNNLSLSSLGTIANSACGTWKQQIDRQPIALESNKISIPVLQANNLPIKSASNDLAPFEFPQLDRSSLIVDFPVSNSTFIPRNTKLANPAPATKRIASPFGWRNRPYSNQLQFHQGIDYGAPFGSAVVSVGNGIVTQVVSGCADFGNLFCGGQLGNWIEVDHGNGIIGTYGHLKRSSISVKEGMRVRKNQPIAEVGSSGWSTGAHLDFRLKVNGKHEDPMKYVMAIEQSLTN